VFDTWIWSKPSGETRKIFDTIPHGSSTQCFRLPYQSKIGKPEHILRPLRPQDELDFENSLITNLTKEDEEDNFPFQIDALPSFEKKKAKKNINGLNGLKEKGMTLYKKHQISGFEELLQFPRWKQFLYLVPNGKDEDGNGIQPYLIFKDIIEEIAVCDGSIDDAKEWYNNLFDDNPNDMTMANFDNIHREESGYTSFLFEQIVKKCCPDFLRFVASKRIHEFYLVNIDDEPNIKYIEENEEAKWYGIFFRKFSKMKNLPCAESYVEKCPFRQISNKFPKNLAYRKCKNLAHYLAKLNGLKWAKLGAEA